MFRTNDRLLSHLLNDVESGAMQLPDFQRGWIWDDARIKSLLASISRGFPIGAVMTLEAGGTLRLKSRVVEGVDDDRGGSPDSYLLDGQQRLTSLYQALMHPDAVNTSERSRGRKVKRWYYIDMRAALNPVTEREQAIISLREDKRAVEDIGRIVVLDVSTPELEFENHHMPTESLLGLVGSGRWLRDYERYWLDPIKEHPDGDPRDFVDKFDEEIVKKFSEYLLPVIELSKDTEKEAVCIVFEKVNTGGEPLNVFELSTASFAADDSFSLREDWAERRDRLFSKWSVLKNLRGDQFLQALALLKTQSDARQAEQEGETGRQLPVIACQRKQILDLELDDYHIWGDRVEGGFVDAAKFLRSQYVFGEKNVPYTTQLVSLAALFVELGPEAHTLLARERLERWYWSGVFGEVYGGAIETQFANDLVDVAKYVRDGTEPRMVTEANFVPQRLISLKTRNSAAYKGLYALQMKHGAKDWMSGNGLSFATFDDAHIDIHHIFPVAWCQSDNVPSRLYDSIINKTPMDAHTNRVMGGRAPSIYLRRLEREAHEGQLDPLLRSHWLDVDHLRNDQFGEHFVQRGQYMLDLIGSAMGRSLGDGRHVFSEALQNAGVADAYVDDEPEYSEVGESELEPEPDAA